jgi:hypothetical protein
MNFLYRTLLVSGASIGLFFSNSPANGGEIVKTIITAEQYKLCNVRQNNVLTPGLNGCRWNSLRQGETECLERDCTIGHHEYGGVLLSPYEQDQKYKIDGESKCWEKTTGLIEAAETAWLRANCCNGAGKRGKSGIVCTARKSRPGSSGRADELNQGKLEISCIQKFSERRAAEGACGRRGTLQLTR